MPCRTVVAPVYVLAPESVQVLSPDLIRVSVFSPLATTPEISCPVPEPRRLTWLREVVGTDAYGAGHGQHGGRRVDDGQGPRPRRSD